jgi:hypothetical protein
MKRRELLKQFGSLAVTATSSVLMPSESHSQPAKSPAICFLAGQWADPAPEVLVEDSFRSLVRGLSDIGNSPGRNFELLPRLPMVPDLEPTTDELATGLKPDLIVAAALPIEFSTQFPLAVNLWTAKALGVTLAPSLLTRADEAIE